MLTISKPAMQNIKMKISHPRFVIPGDSSDLDLEFPRCLRKHVQSDSNTVPEGTKENVKGSLFPFPQVRWFKALSCFTNLICVTDLFTIFTFISFQDIKIQGGATFSWPIWFHAATPGNFSLYLSLYYEMESTTDIPYRTLRMHYNVEVNWQYYIRFYFYFLPYCTCRVYSIWNQCFQN